MKSFCRIAVFLLTIAFCWCMALPTQAQTLTTLHSFTGGDDGRSPESALTQGIDGNFYGTTAYGGINGYGTVFRINPNGVLTTLYYFSGENDGNQPGAALLQGHDGNFYGTTFGGDGTVFRIDPNGVLATLHSFSNGNDGADPYGGLVQGKDGNFYGTTFEGGGLNKHGTVFRITPSGVFTTLHTFSGNDGGNPWDTLVQGTDGNFYGTTEGGGHMVMVPYFVLLLMVF